jgi:hypothetical protein
MSVPRRKLQNSLRTQCFETGSQKTLGKYGSPKAEKRRFVRAGGAGLNWQTKPEFLPSLRGWWGFGISQKKEEERKMETKTLLKIAGITSSPKMYHINAAVFADNGVIVPRFKGGGTWIKTPRALNHVPPMTRCGDLHKAIAIGELSFDSEGIFLTGPITLPTETAGDDSYPEFNLMNEEFWTIPVKTLEWIIQACSYDDVRLYFNGAYFTQGEIVATDGSRMHTAPIDSGNRGGIIDESILREAVKISKILKTDMVKIMFGALKEGCQHRRPFQIVFDGVILFGDTIDSPYPNHKRVKVDSKNGPVSRFNGVTVNDWIPAIDMAKKLYKVSKDGFVYMKKDSAILTNESAGARCLDFRLVAESLTGVPKNTALAVRAYDGEEGLLKQIEIELPGDRKATLMPIREQK